MLYEYSIPSVVNSLIGVIQAIAVIVNSKMEVFVVMHGGIQLTHYKYRVICIMLALKCKTHPP